MKFFLFKLFLWAMLLLGIIIFITPFPGGIIIISITILYLAKSSNLVRKLVVKLNLKKFFRKLKND